MVNLKEAFEKYEDEYLNFGLVTSKLSKWADMHAFMLLDRLAPGPSNMISAAEHDEFFLGTDCEALAEVITEEQVCELRRCGIRYQAEYDCLCMFA
jgi:hypothetical protein